ncbi:hypothetical protein BDZ91DRAFT_731913 [Kalaharituber pfeilii]|nr:hypothetical protein BDZ91DRAFT_731913 [Kalaharituber pfeilii]
MWGHLVLEIVTTIFWLGGWASLAAWSSANSIYFEHVKGKTYSKWATTAAGAAFGAVMWVLWIVTFVTFAMRLHRHRHDPQNQHLSQFGFPEKGQNHEMNRVQGVQSTPQQYPQPTQTPVYPESTPTPVQYVQGPPPPQWQQSPPPQQYGQ